MKKHYFEPEIEIKSISFSDIIVCSDTPDTGNQAEFNDNQNDIDFPATGWTIGGGDGSSYSSTSGGDSGSSSSQSSSSSLSGTIENPEDITFY